MCSFVVVIGVIAHLGMALINSIKYNLCKYLLTKTWKASFLCFSHWKVQAGSAMTPAPWTFDGTPWPHWRWYLRLFSLKWPKRMNLQLPISVYNYLFRRFSTIGKNLQGVTVTPPLVRQGLKTKAIVLSAPTRDILELHQFPWSSWEFIMSLCSLIWLQV